jgi:hypothetical protein
MQRQTELMQPAIIRLLEVLVANGVVASAFLDPLHAAIAVGFLVGNVLFDTGVHTRLTGGLRSVFW